MPILIQTTLSAISWLYADVLFGSAEVISLPIFKFGTRGKLGQIQTNSCVIVMYVHGRLWARAEPARDPDLPWARAFQVKRNQLYMCMYIMFMHATVHVHVLTIHMNMYAMYIHVHITALTYWQLKIQMHLEPV